MNKNYGFISQRPQHPRSETADQSEDESPSTRMKTVLKHFRSREVRLVENED